MRIDDQEPVRISSIEVRGNRRPVDPERVNQIAESIKQIGLQTPITARLVPLEDGDEALVLVAGRHRLAACRQLGMEMIPTIVWSGATDDDARMWEIAENLHRKELTALERDEHVAEWVRISERVSRQVDAKPLGGRPEGGTRAAARNLGLSEPDARRALKVASLPEEAKTEARTLGLDDNRSALLKAAAADNPVQAIRDHAAKRAPAMPQDEALDVVTHRERAMAAREVAITITNFVPADWLPDVIANLITAGASNIASHISAPAPPH